MLHYAEMAAYNKALEILILLMHQNTYSKALAIKFKFPVTRNFTPNQRDT